MKKTYIIILAFMAIVMAGCKENSWMDWKVQNELWLQNNLLNDSTIIMTADSLQYKVIKDPGASFNDVRPQATSTVTCDYEGRLINGTVFDSGKQVSMSVSSLIPGFAEGLTKIHNHGDIILYIPWQLGYGKEGSGTEGNSVFIPPYSTLIFRIHVGGVQ